MGRAQVHTSAWHDTCKQLATHMWMCSTWVAALSTQNKDQQVLLNLVKHMQTVLVWHHATKYSMAPTKRDTYRGLGIIYSCGAQAERRYQHEIGSMGDVSSFANVTLSKNETTFTKGRQCRLVGQSGKNSRVPLTYKQRILATWE